MDIFSISLSWSIFFFLLFYDLTMSFFLSFFSYTTPSLSIYSVLSQLLSLSPLFSHQSFSCLVIFLLLLSSPLSFFLAIFYNVYRLDSLSIFLLFFLFSQFSLYLFIQVSPSPPLSLRSLSLLFLLSSFNFFYLSLSPPFFILIPLFLLSILSPSLSFLFSRYLLYFHFSCLPSFLIFPLSSLSFLISHCLSLFPLPSLSPSGSSLFFSYCRPSPTIPIFSLSSLFSLSHGHPDLFVTVMGSYP